MARHYESTEARCPFYRGEDTMTIWCEGIRDGCTLQLAFGRDASDYRKAFCRSEWQECRVAQMLWNKHEETGCE